LIILLKAVGLDYETAINQLIRANYSPRDAQGNITSQLTSQQMKDLRGKVNEEEITQGYLWMSAIISPAKQQIQFAVVDTQQVSNSPVTPINRLLTMQDSFLISNLSYFLMIYQYTGGSLQNPDFSSNNNWTPVTFAAPWYNNGLGVEFSPGFNMMWIGAYLTLSINKKVIIPYWDCYRHYKAPGHQPTPGFPVPSAYIPNQKMQHDGSTDGFYPMQPNVVIGGGRNNNLYLQLPANIPAGIGIFGATGYGVTFQVMASICCRGILMQNSTTVK
jgi:hypothetical protein